MVFGSLASKPKKVVKVEGGFASFHEDALEADSTDANIGHVEFAIGVR